MIPFNGFMMDTSNGYVHYRNLGGNDSSIDSISGVLSSKAPDKLTVAADLVSKMLFGEDSTAKDFIDYLVKAVSTESNGYVNNSSTSTIYEVVYKTKVTETDAEKIAYAAADYAIEAILYEYLLTDIIADECLPQIVFEKMVDFMLHILGNEYDFSLEVIDGMPNVEEALDLICSFIDWDYIYNELEEITHQLLIRMTIGTLIHVETTIKDSMTGGIYGP